MIPVTRPYLPNRERLARYIDGIYERGWLTNRGKLVRELTRRLEDYLGVDNLLLVANGTLALQIAYRTLNVNEAKGEYKPEAITTPFTFVATADSLKWEGIEPVFGDIDARTWCLAADNIEELVSCRTSAIVPVHVFGNACDVENIDVVARKYNLKVIYDAAHAFSVKYKGESLLRWGDAATLSFHATKVFHTAEGGAVVFKHKEDLERARNLINFGITGPERVEGLGINAKMSELQAAMGLCVLDEMGINLGSRSMTWDVYNQAFRGMVQLQERHTACTNNYAYFPIVLGSEREVLRVMLALNKIGVNTRRYFYPSLDSLDYWEKITEAPVSRGIASRVLCLPIYDGLECDQVEEIVNNIREQICAGDVMESKAFVSPYRGDK